MAKVYTTSTASVKIPVFLSFICPKCGKLGTAGRTAQLASQATVGGYNSTAAGFAAQRNLMASAESQLQNLEKSLEQGHLNALLDQSGRSPGGKVLCPHCGLRQVLDTGERRTLYTPAFPWVVTGLAFAIVFIFVLALSLSAAAGGRVVIPPALTLGAELLCIAALVAVICVNRAQSKKAYDDPALMEKRYRSVLNPHMDATVMLGVGSTRSVRIPRR